MRNREHARNSHRRHWHKLPVVGLLCAFVLVAVGCAELQRPKPEPYFSKPSPPVKQEFRWSNGKLPATVDPALAASPPETDLVRAVFEGLTELDPVTLAEIPAAAESWTASEDNKTWTFVIRKDAKWSDGRPVIPDDFIRSWRRAAEHPGSVAHRKLLANIVGMAELKPPPTGGETDSESVEESTAVSVLGAARLNRGRTPSPTPTATAETQPSPGAEPQIGVRAADPRTLVVELVHPDRDLPKLVAHPIFRPVPDGIEDLTPAAASVSATNGPFTIAEANDNGVVLQRSETYWGREAVTLERVRLVPAENPERVLEAYRSGELDAVSNVQFSPLVLKLLSPYEDFRRTSFAAVNLLELNPERPALKDRRVRQALSLALDRDRLAEGELEGTTRPAYSFTPFSSEPRKELQQDKDKARDLMEEAGYPEGLGFPVLKVVVNRNDTQQRVAKSVAEMWKETLGVTVEIDVRELSEIDKVLESREFDVLRRGAVLSTSDEFVNMRTIFGDLKAGDRKIEELLGPSVAPLSGGNNNSLGLVDTPTPSDTPEPILTETDALFELTAIPLYFPVSFSLVKPYVDGFVTNPLDAPLLSRVAIKENWQPTPSESES